MSKLLYPLSYVTSPEQVTLKFRAQFVTDAAPDFQVPAGSISTLTRTSEGLYVMTLQEKYPCFIGGHGTVMVAAASVLTAAAHRVFIDPADYVASTGVLTFRTGWADPDDAGAAGAAVALADIANNDWVYFELTFGKVSTVAPTGAIPA